MSTDIITCMKLNDEEEENKTIAVKEINFADSCFIISSVLGHCIKNKSPVLIISVHTSLTHLQNVGLKMNYNLQRHLESGLVKHYDLGFELANGLVTNKGVSLDSELIKIKSIISEVQSKFNKCHVIIDGFSHLFDFQFTLKEVNIFLSEITRYVREYHNSFLFCFCNVTSDVDLSNTLANLICHKAHTVIEVGSLSSGWSSDVSGNFTIRHPGLKFKTEHAFKLHLNSTPYLYKLFDRGVKLFAPGTV